MIETSERTSVRVASGERLGDHAAHRGADHVRRSEVELAQQPGAVVGHVAERVAGGAAASAAAAAGCVGGRPLTWVERPMSRLSKRTT